MYYIFNADGFCLSTVDGAVNKEDLQTRGEFVVESQEIYDSRYIKIMDGQIVRFEPDEVYPIEVSIEPIDENILDLTTAIIELSDRIEKIEGGQ